MNDDTVSPFRSGLRAIYEYTYIDETWDEQLNPKDVKVWVEDIRKEKMLDELFGEL